MAEHSLDDIAASEGGATGGANLHGGCRHAAAISRQLQADAGHLHGRRVCSADRDGYSVEAAGPKH